MHLNKSCKRLCDVNVIMATWPASLLAIAIQYLHNSKVFKLFLNCYYIHCYSKNWGNLFLFFTARMHYIDQN